MNVFLAKITNKTNVDKILNKDVFIHEDVYNFENEIQVDMPVFLVFSGDKSKIDWPQGLIGIGKIVKAPFDKGYDKEKPRYFRIEIKPVFIFDQPLDPKFTKLHPKYQDDLYEVPYVGANHFPNQAIAKASGQGAIALFKLMREINPLSVVEFSDYLPVTEFHNNTKEQFKKYLSEKNESSTVGSYINALDNLPKYLEEKGIQCPFRWDRYVDKEKLKNAANFVKDESKKENGGILSNYNPPSHWNNGWFYSGINNYLNFLNETQSSLLDIDKFLSDILKSGLIFNKNHIIRFISSQLTKPFVILTGLSGSGKTKLAYAFALWISSELYREKDNLFIAGDTIDSDRVSYKIIRSDGGSVTFEQPETNTKVTLPLELISEWILVIKQNNYDKSVSPRTIRETVAQITKYSPQLNSFETHLKASAFYIIDNQNIKSHINQFCLLPVGADWTNREPLLGYPSALENGRYVKPDNGVLELLVNSTNNQDLPFFLILDEMNLSHVERYFADFLSAMESGESIPLHSDKNGMKADDDLIIPHEIKLPSNLFIIGTVNIDETTYMFSPKVLDRANVIEFRVSEKELDKFLDNPIKPDLDKIRGAGAGMAADFLRIAREEITDFDDKDVIKIELLKFFKELKKTGAEFGYRTSSEIFRFIAILKKLLESEGRFKKSKDENYDQLKDWLLDDIIDVAVLQKLLPKLHGSRKKLDPVLKTLSVLCLKDEIDNTASLIEGFEKNPETIDSDNNVRFKRSLEKILRMKKRADQDGFTSFAEA